MLVSIDDGIYPGMLPPPLFVAIFAIFPVLFLTFGSFLSVVLSLLCVVVESLFVLWLGQVPHLLVLFIA